MKINNRSYRKHVKELKKKQTIKLTMSAMMVALYVIANIFGVIRITNNTSIFLGAGIVVFASIKIGVKEAITIGIIGGALTDLLLGYGFWPTWNLGAGLIVWPLLFTSKFKWISLPVGVITTYAMVGILDITWYAYPISYVAPQLLLTILTTIPVALVGWLSAERGR